MSIRAVAARRLMHRARVTRLELDESSLDTDYTERTVYNDLPCLMIPQSDRAIRDADRAVGVEMYKLLHMEGTLGVNDRVSVSFSGVELVSGMYSGPTSQGLVLNETELKSVSYGL